MSQHMEDPTAGMPGSPDRPDSLSHKGLPQSLQLGVCVAPGGAKPKPVVIYSNILSNASFPMSSISFRP